MTTAIPLLLPLVAVGVLGYSFRRFGFFPPAFIEHLNRFAYYVALPALLFESTSTVSTAGEDYVALFWLVPAFTVATALAALPATRIVPPGVRGAVVQAGYRSNMAYLGLPVVAGLLGESTVPITAVALAPAVVTNSVLSIVILRLYRSDVSFSVGRQLLDIVRNPLILSIALGMVVAALGVTVPSSLKEFVGLVARTGLPLVLIVVGYSVRLSRLSRRLSPVFLAVAIKLVIMPILAYLIVGLRFGSGHVVLRTATLLAAMPTAVASQSFAAVLGADEEVTASAVSLSTLLCLLSVPAWFMLL